MHKRAYILFETLMTLLVLVVFIPTIFGWLLLEVRDNRKQSVEQEVHRQLDFAQRYLQTLCDVAVTISVTQTGLSIVSSTDVVEAGCRKDAIYVRREAYRYLTTEPVMISDFSVETLNDSLYQIRLNANNKYYTFQLIN